MKTKSAKAESTATETPALKKGDTVRFIGWQDGNAPEGAEGVAEGSTGTVAKPTNKKSGLATIHIDDGNGELIELSVLPGVEVELATEGEQEAEDVVDAKPAKKKAAKAKATPVEVVEPETEPEVVIPLKLSAGVKNAIKEHDGDALTAVRALINQAGQTDYILGGVLAHIESKKIHETIVDDEGNQVYHAATGFAAYIKKELDVDYRKARYLVGWYSSFSRAGITEKQVAGLGWAKAKELIAVANNLPDEVAEWLETAKECNTKELNAKVTKRLAEVGALSHGRGAGASTTLTSFNFKAFSDQGDMITTAIETARQALSTGEEGEEISMGQCLAHICQEWLAAQNPAAAAEAEEEAPTRRTRRQRA